MKKIFLFACFVLSCLWANSQIMSAYAHETTLTAGMGTIIRNWDPDYAISYYETSTIRYIDMVEKGTTNYYRVEVPNDLYFKDIFIENDIAYFCGISGEYGSYSVGMIGYFDLNQMFGASVDFYHICVVEVSMLNKLVEYDDGGYPHVVAIGEYQWHIAPYLYTQFYIVDCPNISMTPNVSYDYSSFNTDEHYTDLVLTNNFVVLTGYNSTVSAICIRKCNKGATFGGLIDVMHVYNTGNLEVYSKLHATAMDNDYYAISYLHIDSNTKTRIRIFDAATDQMVNSEEFIVSEKTEPTEMIYVPDINKLIILEYFQNLSGSTEDNFVYIDPWIKMSYVAYLEYKKGEIFRSLSVMDKHYYVSGIGTTWFVRDVWYALSHYPDADCPLEDVINIECVELVECVDVIMPLYNLPNIHNLVNNNSTIYTTPILQNDCLNN